MKQGDDRPIVLILSHSNYLVHAAGTEKYIHEQAQQFRDRGYEVVHLFPADNERKWHGTTRARVGVNVGSQFLGHVTVPKLLRLLGRWRAAVHACYVQHVMYWQQQDVWQVLVALRRARVPITFFFHDFYCCCPGAFVPCLGQHGEICPADLGRTSYSRLLTSCVDRGYAEALAEWRRSFHPLFSLVDTFVAPSAFVKRNLATIYPCLEDRIIVQGLLRLTPRGERRPGTTNRKVRVAYVGYRGEHKGWSTWQRLIASPRHQEALEFVHLGSAERYAEHVACYTYSYKDGGPNAAVRLLEELGIDLAFLWSMVSESYSYTLHESIAAGVPVLTTRRSGNIAYTIAHSPTRLGRVFADDDELCAFLLDRQRVAALLGTPRLRYDLEANPYTEVAARRRPVGSVCRASRGLAGGFDGEVGPHPETARAG